LHHPKGNVQPSSFQALTASVLAFHQNLSGLTTVSVSQKQFKATVVSFLFPKRRLCHGIRCIDRPSNWLSDWSSFWL